MVFCVSFDYKAIAFDYVSLYHIAMTLKHLSVATLAIGIIIFVLAAFVAVVLVRPDWFPFQPTFGTNVVTLSAIVSAGAALILASAAFRSVDENRRIREEDAELDFKRRQLDAILTWTQDIERELVSQEYYIDYKRVLGLEAVAARNDWVTMIAQLFGTDFHGIVSRAATYLCEFTEAWAKNPDRVADTAERLAKSLDEVLVAVYNMKSALKL